MLAAACPSTPAGELPNGKKFRDIRELKQLLVQQKDVVARGLTSKLLGYATGRAMTIRDRPNVDSILEQLRAREYGFRDLIELVVLSEVFANK